MVPSLVKNKVMPQFKMTYISSICKGYLTHFLASVLKIFPLKKTIIFFPIKSALKKFLIFSQKKFFLYFGKWSSYISSKNVFLIFLEMELSSLKIKKFPKKTF